MPKILITGNGFDLFHHLPTKYQHFMSVMKTIESNQFNNDVSFDELFGHEFKLDSINDYNAIVNNYEVENILFNHDKVNRIKEMLKDNLWYKYFSTVLEIDTWIDFETEVENVLKQLSVLIKSETPQSKKVNNFRDVAINYPDFNLFGIIEHKFFDKELFSVSEKYIDKRKRGLKIGDVLRDLATSFEGFIVIFNQYLVDIVGLFYDYKKHDQIIPFHLINEIYTFNYTPTLEKIYKVDKSKVVYLHGEVNEDCEKQNLVLGVSEISDDIKVEKAYDFTKYHQKIIKRANKKFIEVPKSLKSISGETVFYIMGHSLDKSDREYIIDLFKFLEFDNDKQSKICVFCYNKKDEINKLKNLLGIINKDTLVELNKSGRLYFIEMNSGNIIREFNKELSTSSLSDFRVF
ncbi:AbiH family protein [Flavobacterium frigidarium]|uniref:AbiH family protein n=1 Tax=Flavobacterium frigidarium TaxID=99286 RepID=A0ABV4KFU5_9FLAO